MMNDLAKTGVFVAAGIVAVAVGIYTHLGPSEAGDVTQVASGELFREFSPSSVRAMEIDEADPETGKPKAFKVAQEKGVWVIPSKSNYPADAQQQLGEAAASILAAKKINIESDERSSHALYGVIDPDPKTLEPGTTGVGKRVTLADKSGKKLVQLIVGKGVKDKPDLHYVRIPGQDRVYVVSLKTDKLSTKFEDWIEKDLLKLNSWDIERVAFNDYSIDELRRSIVPRSKIDLRYDSKGSKWELEELETFNLEQGDYEPQALADNEELNTPKLNDLKSALDELKIVDVVPKPEGLAADLRAGEKLASNDEAQESLLLAGFRVARIGDGPMEIVSNEGEVICGTKEGVEYTLRFGRIASGTDSATAGDEAKESSESESSEGDDQPKPEKKETGANRFIMVTAQFNENLLVKPELTPLPGEKPANEPEETTEPKDETDKTSAIESGFSDAAGLLAQATEDEEAKGASAREKPLIDDVSPDTKTNAQEKAAKTDKKPAPDKSKKAADGKSEAKPEMAKPLTPEQRERDRITKENERKQKEYDDKVKKGKEKVKELSDRFSDWYYVVSDSTYQKIHLGRDEIVKEKTPPGGEKKADAHDHDEIGDKDVLKDDLKSLP